MSIGVLVFCACYGERDVDDWKAILFLGSLEAILLIMLLSLPDAYAFFYVKGDEFVYRMPLRKVVLPLSACDIGIDYGFSRKIMARQYWIYVYAGKLPTSYIHHMERMKFNKQGVRLYYNDDLYQALLQELPPAARAKLEKGSDTIFDAKRKGYIL